MTALVAEHGPVDPYVWDGIALKAGDRLGGPALHITAQQISVVAALATVRGCASAAVVGGVSVG